MTDEQEFIHEVESEEKEPETTIDVMDLLQMELRRHMQEALEIRQKVESAKTEYKKKYYEKKLKKNNTEALKVLTAIQRVEKNRIIQEAARVEEIKPDDKDIVA